MGRGKMTDWGLAQLPQGTLSSRSRIQRPRANRSHWVILKNNVLLAWGTRRVPHPSWSRWWYLYYTLHRYLRTWLRMFRGFRRNHTKHGKRHGLAGSRVSARSPEPRETLRANTVSARCRTQWRLRDQVGPFRFTGQPAGRHTKISSS